MDGSECNGPELEADMLADRQPVQVSGTGTTWGLGYHTGKWVLDTLKTVEVVLRGAMEQTVTVVEMRTDNAHCDRFGSIKCETWTDVAQWVAWNDAAGYMPVHGRCLVELNAKKHNYVRKLEAGASHLNTTGSVRTSQSWCCSEYHCLSLRWVQQQTTLKKPMGDVISAVNQLRQTIRTLRLDSNVGLNVISILVNTNMMGYGNVAYRSNIQWEQQGSKHWTLVDTRLTRSSDRPLTTSSDILRATGHKWPQPVQCRAIHAESVLKSLAKEWVVDCIKCSRYVERQ